MPFDNKNPHVSVNKQALKRIISATVDKNQESLNKIAENKEIAKEIKDWEIIESQNNAISKKKEKKKLLKGALLPSGKHLTWKDELEKMLK